MLVSVWGLKVVGDKSRIKGTYYLLPNGIYFGSISIGFWHNRAWIRHRVFLITPLFCRQQCGHGVVGHPYLFLTPTFTGTCKSGFTDNICYATAKKLWGGNLVHVLESRERFMWVFGCKPLTLIISHSTYMKTSFDELKSMRETKQNHTSKGRVKKFAIAPCLRATLGGLDRWYIYNPCDWLRS